MNFFINYLLESGISVAVLTVVYWLFLRKETFFRANRLFLIGSLLFALLQPFLSISFAPISGNGFLKTIATAEQPVNFLQTVTIYSSNASKIAVNTLSSWHILALIYWAGALFFAVLFGVKLLQIYRLISKGIKEKRKNYTLVSLNDIGTPFSFMGFIFYNKALVNQPGYQKMMTHEVEHIKQHHTIDILLLEILIIFQWFNPFVWILKVIFLENHEFLADKAVLEAGVKPADYKILLLSQAVGLSLQLTNGFNQSLIKKRIKMMSKMKSKRITLTKYLSGVVAIALLTLIFACNQQKKTGSEAEETATEVEKVESIKPDLSKEKPEPKEVVKNAIEEDKVFTIVEEKPEFEGGYKALQKFLKDNVDYPVSAQENGIQGKVYVKFIIDKEGNVKNPEILRGVDPALDKEALRVVKLMPKWKPGKQRGKPVSIAYNVPINFVLQ